MSKTIPTEEGEYYWTEWARVVRVYRRGKSLYVCIPGGVEVRITKRIAGSFQAWAGVQRG